MPPEVVVEKTNSGFAAPIPPEAIVPDAVPLLNESPSANSPEVPDPPPVPLSVVGPIFTVVVFNSSSVVTSYTTAVDVLGAVPIVSVSPTAN